MITNNIKKGARLTLSGGRLATMGDNKRGIIRMVEVEATNGFYNDIGSVYVDEILTADGERVELSSAQTKKLDKIRRGFRYVARLG